MVQFINFFVQKYIDRFKKRSCASTGTTLEKCVSKIKKIKNQFFSLLIFPVFIVFLWKGERTIILFQKKNWPSFLSTQKINCLKSLKCIKLKTYSSFKIRLKAQSFFLDFLKVLEVFFDQTAQSVMEKISKRISPNSTNVFWLPDVARKKLD